MNFIQFKEKYQVEEVEHFPHQVPSQPILSVIVQTYNHENYIRQCLDSILAQKTDFDFEILLGEDASTDNTRGICIEYAQKYPEKIRLFLHHPANKIKVLDITTGNYNAFYNFYNTQGKYIAFCEGDDYWTDPFKLQKQVNFLKTNPEFILSYHKFEEIFENHFRRENKKILEQPLKDLSSEELSSLIFHPLLSTVCFRNVLQQLPEEMMFVINVDSFILSILGTYGKAKFQPEIISSIYRRHAGGIWTEKMQHKRYTLKLLTFKNLTSFHQNSGNPVRIKHFKNKIKKYYRLQIVFCLKRRISTFLNR